MVKDMTKGSPFKLLLAFAVPMILGNLFQQFYNMADSIIVGQFIGKTSLAAVGATGSLSFLVIGFVNGLCSGMCIPISQRFGAKDMPEVRRLLANAVYISVFAAVVLTGIVLLGTGWLLDIMQTPDDIRDLSYMYIFIIFAGIPCTFLYNLPAGVLRALGDSKTPLYFLILSSFLNIALDLLFIITFKMNVEGAAIATVISQGISGVLCSFFMLKKFPILHLSKQEWTFSPKLCARLFSMGAPTGLQFSITAIGSVVLQSAVNTLGSDIVAAVTAADKITSVAIQPVDTMGFAMATFGGQNLGAGKIDRIRKGLKSDWLMGMTYALICMAIFIPFGSKLALLFIQPQETAILSNVGLFLSINACFFIFLVTLIMFRNTLQGIGYSSLAMFAGLAELVGRAGAAFLLVKPFGFTGICFASPVAWVAATLFLTPALFRMLKKLDSHLHTPTKKA